MNSRVVSNWGWFHCLYGQTLRGSIFDGGRVRMNPDKIRISIGGERLGDERRRSFWNSNWGLSMLMMAKACWRKESCE